MAEQLAPSGGGLHGSFGAVKFDVSDETSRNLLESIFKRENLGTILKWGAGIAIACLVGKAAKDYWNRKKTASVTAMESVQGKLDAEYKNEKKFMAVKGVGEGVTAMRHYGKDADAKIRSEGGQSMMIVGYEGEDMKTLTDTYKDKAGQDVPIGISVEIDGQEKETIEMMESPMKTTGNLLQLLKRKYKRDFKISRDGKVLEDNLTLAQAARTGSTVNLIAKEG